MPSPEAAVARAERKVRRWSRLEVLIAGCFIVVLAAIVVAVTFVVPIRRTVDRDHCLVRATALAVGRYEDAVGSFQNTPAGSPERAAGAVVIHRSVEALRAEVASCA